MNLSKLKTSPLAAGKYRTQHGTTDLGPRSVAGERQILAQYRAAAVEDMAHKAVRLGTEEFVDNFFPLPEGVAPTGLLRPMGNVFGSLANVKGATEAEVSRLFVQALNAAGVVNPTFLQLAECQHSPDPGDFARLKVDASFFRPDFLPTDGRPHWSDQIVPIEFKSYATKNDPYDDRDKKGVDADAIDRKKVRGQVINYAEHVFRYQHRIALYMLIIIGRKFRFVRWDRSGTIVTPLVDFVDRPDILCEMLWRMSLLNDEQLGLDPSATRILREDEEFAKMDEAAKLRDEDVDDTARTIKDGEVIPEGFVFRYVREEFQKSLSPEWPRYCLDVPDGETVRKLLVGRPSFLAYGMTGRGTRGYVALDCNTSRFVWLKDAWRAHYELVDQEGIVLQQLNQAGVANVPTLECHGDILNQTTLTPEFWERANPPTAAEPPFPAAPAPGPRTASSSRTLRDPPPPSSKSLKRGISEVEDSTDATLPNGEPREDCPLRRHKHYRLVVKEVCMPLVKFRSGQELLQVILSCVVAHRDATLKAKIVHRDVSGGNVLILPRLARDAQTGEWAIERLGMLVDWELSKPVQAQGTPSRARQPERTGTWQYMSVATLDDHVKVVETSDELESFFHIVLYYGVRYLRSNCKDVGNFIDGFFDSYVVHSGEYQCGQTKSQAMSSGKLKMDNAGTLLKFNSPIDRFLKRNLGWFKAHYAVMAYEKALAKNEQSAKTPQPRVPSPTTSHRPAKRRNAVRLIPVGPLPSLPEDSDSDSEEIEKPAASVYERASQAQDHNYMAQVLVTEINNSDWEDIEDRVKGDNVPALFRPTRGVGPTPVASSKRQRASAPV